MLDSGNYQEAQPIVRQTFQLREHALGPDDLDTIEALGGLGQALSVSGKYAEGEAYLQEALRRFQRKGLPDHLIAMICIKEIAFARVMQGDPDTADKLLSDLILKAERVLGTNAMRTLQFRRIRARTLAENGRFAEAEALAQSTLELRSSQTSDLRGTAYTLLYLGRAQVQQDKLTEAEPHLVEALGIFREKVPGKPELVAMTANWLGAIQLARKNYSNAETLLLSGPELFLDPAVEMTVNERRLAVGHIVALYQATKRPDEAARWQMKLAALVKPSM